MSRATWVRVLFIVLVGVFVATLCVSVGAYVVFNRGQLQAAEAARERLAAPEPASASVQSILRDTSASALPLLDQFLSGKAITASLQRQIARAGVSVKPGNVLLWSAVLAGIGLWLGAQAGGFLAVVLALVGGGAPFWWLRRAQRVRLARFQDQLPDAIDMLVNAMRAGYSLQVAMKFIGEEMPAPLGAEFALVYDAQRLGIDARSAMLALQERVDSADLRMFVTAVLLQRETGGNLSEVLGNIAEVMRQRADLQRQVATLTAESRMSARVLSLLPVIVFTAILIMDPHFVAPMLNSGGGRAALALSALAVASGYFIMMRIAAVDL